MLLNSIVSEVYEHIGASFETKKGRSCSDIALWIPVCFDDAVEASQ